MSKPKPKPKIIRMWSVRHRLGSPHTQLWVKRADAQMHCDLLNKRTEHYSPHHKESDYGFRLARIEVREISCRNTP